MTCNILLAVSSLFCTISDTSDIFDNAVEIVLETVETDETTDVSELTEHLESYRTHPLNLNTATLEQLEQLGLFNDFQISALLQYRKDYGDLTGVSELYYVPGFTAQHITLLTPYITFQKTENFKLTLNHIRRFGTSVLMTRYVRGLSEKQGFSDNDTSKKSTKYIGSPDMLWMRYQFNAMNKLKVSLVAKKDAGEEFFKGSQKRGFPFYSGYIALSDVGRIKRLVLGNYQLQFGQGLCLWTGFSSGKSVDGNLMKKRAQGVRPYGSSAEYGYFQGVASTLQFGNTDVSLFFSHRKLDANVSDLDENGVPQSISAIVETGYHRTLAELQKKKQAEQTVFGMHVNRHWQRFRIGTTAHCNTLNVEYLPKIRPDNQFSIPPKTNINMGLDWESIGKISRTYGEFAISKNGGKAFITGSRFLLNQRLSANVGLRYYERNYQNFFSAGLSENSDAVNEKAVNIALFAELTKAWKVAAMTDIFEFPWLSYSENEPLYGQEYQLKFFYTPSSRLSGYFTYRYKTKQSVSSNAATVKDFGMFSKQSLRAHFDHKISECLTFKHRLEYAFASKEKSFLMVQDVKYAFRKRPLSVLFRYAVFDTGENYAMRIFIYENDVLYGSTLQNYAYKGSRFCLLFQYQPTRRITFWLKYANTNIANKTSTGSGLDEIQGRDRAEVKIQMRLIL